MASQRESEGVGRLGKCATCGKQGTANKKLKPCGKCKGEIGGAFYCDKTWCVEHHAMPSPPGFRRFRHPPTPPTPTPPPATPATPPRLPAPSQRKHWATHKTDCKSGDELFELLQTLSAQVTVKPRVSREFMHPHVHEQSLAALPPPPPLTELVLVLPPAKNLTLVRSDYRRAHQGRPGT